MTRAATEGEREHLTQVLSAALRTAVRGERPTHEQIAAFLAESVLRNNYRRAST